MKVKPLIASTLKAVGIFEVTRQTLIDLGLHVPNPHGHDLLIHAMDSRATAEEGVLRGHVCIEIGSTREELPGQGSTVSLAKKCDELGMHFITVDMDPENTDSAIQSLAQINKDFEAVNSKGEDYLARYRGRLDFLYLDAFDVNHKNHAARRRERYKEILGSDINDEACHEMHLKCAIEAVRVMDVGGEIVFDDAWRKADGWGGKGATAMPYLLDGGFSVTQETKNTVRLSRVKAI